MSARSLAAVLAALWCVDPAFSLCSSTDELATSSDVQSRVLISGAELEDVKPKEDGWGVKVASVLDQFKEWTSNRTVLKRLDWPSPLEDAFGESGGTVYYVEAGSGGKEFACRAERWRPRGRSTEPQILAAFGRQRERLRNRPELIALLDKGFLPTTVISYRYDEKGLLSEAASVSQLSEPPELKTACYAYDNLGRFSVYAELEGARSCEGADRLVPKSGTDMIERYTYVDSQHLWVARRSRTLLDDDGKRLTLAESYGYPGSPLFKATIRGDEGLVELTGRSRLPSDPKRPEWEAVDRNPANSHVSRFTYYFKHPGPVELLDDLTRVGHYDRVRVNHVAGPWGSDHISEVFTAEGRVLARYYVDEKTFRQDIFEGARLSRVLIIGGQMHVGSKRSPLYIEDPTLLRSFSASKGTTMESVASRVYEVKPNGKWTLVAAGWLEQPVEMQTSGAMAQKAYRFETVDGRKTWVDNRSMLQEYGLDSAMAIAQKFGMPNTGRK